MKNLRYNDGGNKERGEEPCRKISACVRCLPPICPWRLSLRLRCAILRIAFFICIFPFTLRRKHKRKGASSGRGNNRGFSKSDFLCGKSPFVLENIFRRWPEENRVSGGYGRWMSFSRQEWKSTRWIRKWPGFSNAAWRRAVKWLSIRRNAVCRFWMQTGKRQ